MGEISGLVPMVTKMASRMGHLVYRTADQEDVRQEGFVGLMEAASRYDPGHSCSLATFASKRVWGAMHEQVRTLSKQSRERPVEAVPEGSASPWAPDSRSPESAVMLARFRRFLACEFHRLDPPLRTVVEGRYFQGVTVRDLGARLGVSRTTILRWEAEALETLKAWFLAETPANPRR
jgi:RNA polymerase sigma factor (sigma-70 family)